MTEKRVVIVGAGIAGLTAALRLALHGLEVTVIESVAGTWSVRFEAPIPRALMLRL